MQVRLCYALKMANIKPVRIPSAQKPEAPKTIKSIQSVSEPVVVKPHQLQFVAEPDGHNWRCSCGYLYPRPPIEVLLESKLDEWLNPLVEKHENA